MAIAEDLSNPHLSVEDDDGSLFGGDGDDPGNSGFGLHDDDGDSLFGADDVGASGADDVLSLFMDETSPARPTSSQSSSASGSLFVTSPPPVALALPSRPAVTAPTLLFPTLPAMPSPSLGSPDSLLAASPTPSCEGARCSGSPDVSTHSFQNAAALAASDASDLELERLLELELGVSREGQPINSHAASLEPAPSRDAHVCRGDELKGLATKAVATAIKFGLGIPRRVDLDPQRWQALLPYIALNGGAISRLVEPLGLDNEAGAALAGDVENFLSIPSVATRIDSLDMLNRDNVKDVLIQISLEFLRDIETTGRGWFSRRDLDGRQKPAPVWPDDSSILTCHLVNLFHRCIKNCRQGVSPEKKKKQHTDKIARPPKTKKTAQKRKKSTMEVSCEFVPAIPQGPFQTPATIAADQAASPNTARPILVPRPINLLDPGVSQGTTREAKKLKRENLKAGYDPFPKVPPDAKLKYVIYIMRPATGPTKAHATMGIPAIELEHSDGFQSGGFWFVTGRCRDLGIIGQMEILTQDGFELVQSGEEWEARVRKVYSEEVMGGVVKVRFHSYV